MALKDTLFHLEGCGFSYDGNRVVLRDLDLSIAAGDRLALHGTNGSGKTTLLHLLVGLLRPSGGKLSYRGQPLGEEASFRLVRQEVGLLFQDAEDQLFCPTVLEDVAFGSLNLGLAPVEAVRRSEEVLEELGLAGFGPRITHRLSGGEKRLVSLATILAMRPQVLLLDEPTAGLDEAASERVLALLERLEASLIVVSHEPHVLRRLCQRHLHLQDGQPVWSLPEDSLN